MKCKNFSHVRGRLEFIMARGGFPGMGNMNNMLKQAQKMQQDMAKLQEELKEKKVTASTGGGVVQVTATGAREISEIIIDKDVCDPTDVEMLQDLLLTAVNEALRMAEEIQGSEMKKITGGLGLPGLI